MQEANQNKNASQGLKKAYKIGSEFRDRETHFYKTTRSHIIGKYEFLQTCNKKYVTQDNANEQVTRNWVDLKDRGVTFLFQKT